MTICSALKEKLQETGRYKEYVSVVCEPDKDSKGNYPNHKGYIPIQDNKLQSYKMDITNNKPCIDGMNFNSEEVYKYESKATILVQSSKSMPKHIIFAEESREHKYSYLMKYYNILGYFKDMDSKLEGTDILVTSCLRKSDKLIYNNMKKEKVLFIDTFFSEEFLETQDNLAAVKSLIKAIKQYFREVNNGIIEPLKIIRKNKEISYICKCVDDMKIIVKRDVLLKDIAKYELHN